MSNSKTIIKNSIFLYFRMLLVMGVTLFTSRVVLDELGASDYGIYSLVGGIVTMLAFFRGAMSNATRRYLSFDIGKNDLVRLQKTFSVTLTIHLLIAFLVLILAETLGLWYVFKKMVFPPDRFNAVVFVYQFSILTFLLNIIQVPYDALIQAREKMKVYAIVSVLEVILKLLIVYMLVIFGSDKLIWYAILTFIVAFVIRFIYQFYCRKNFVESRYKFVYDKDYFKELISYSGWNLFGSLATMTRGQGNNIVLNLFFGTIINAAYGLTTQVQNAVQQFVNSFQLAINPQIIKTYANGDLQRNHKLIFMGSKLSFFMLVLIICPISLNIDFILMIWLKNPPPYTAIFIQLVLIHSLIDCISGPLMVGAQSTGKIKWYQIIVGSILLLNVPVSYTFIKYLNYSPDIVFTVMIFLSCITLFFRLFFLKKMIYLSIKGYFYEVLLPIIYVSICSYLFIYFILPYINFDNVWINFICKVLFITFFNLVIIVTIGLNKNEKTFVKDLFNKNKGKS